MRKPLEKWTFMCNTISFHLKCKITKRKSWGWKVNSNTELQLGFFLSIQTQSKLAQDLGAHCSTALCLNFLTCIISELYQVTSATSVFCSDEFVFIFLLLILGQNIFKACYSDKDFVDRVVLLCQPVAIQNKNLATVNILAGQRQTKNGYLSIEQQDSLLLLSIAHHGSSWEGFSLRPSAPRKKAWWARRIVECWVLLTVWFSLQKKPW